MCATATGKEVVSHKAEQITDALDNLGEPPENQAE